MTLENDIATLARAPLFHLMDHEALRLLAFAGEHRALKSGDVLFRKSDKADGGFVVVKGAIAVDGGSGGEPFVAEPGALIGQTALFSRGGERPATATARVPSAVLRISPTLMRRVLQEFPAAAEAIHGALSTELSTLSGGLERVRKWMLEIDEHPSLHLRGEEAVTADPSPPPR
ncbi:MAG TPA: Crp/Fnr family transcriptional regulator [Beijerinckiaceae bacterium]|jgi:CRP-like cAMP-binding protein